MTDNIVRERTPMIVGFTMGEPPNVEGLRIRILPRAFEKMVTFIQLHPKEISGYGRVEDLGLGGFLITDIILLHQDESAAETEITDEDNALFL